MKPKPISPMRRATASWPRIERDSECLDDVGGAASAGHRPVSVLGDRHPGTRDDERGQRRDVEGAGAVGPGSAQVDRPVRRHHAHRPSAHHAREGGKLLGRLATRPEHCQQRGDLRCRCRPVHQLVHGRLGKRRGQHGAGRHQLDGRANGRAMLAGVRNLRRHRSFLARTTRTPPSRETEAYPRCHTRSGRSAAHTCSARSNGEPDPSPPTDECASTIRSEARGSIRRCGPCRLSPSRLAALVRSIG